MLILAEVLIFFFEMFYVRECKRHIKNLDMNIPIVNGDKGNPTATRHVPALRRLPPWPVLDEPLRNLNNGEEVAHRISRSKRPNCRLLPEGQDETAYKIKKMENAFATDFTKFYAIRGQDSFKETNNDPVDTNSNFENLIGYAQCKHGWISEVWTNDGTGKGESEGASLINARDCGISTVLRRYCLKDPAIYNLGEDNLALAQLENYADVLNHVKKNCKNAFVYSQFAVNPKSAGFGHLSGAISEKYDQMIVQELMRGVGFFKYYETAVAKRNYNPNNGNIEPCECIAFKEIRQNEECQAFLGNWYFCK